MALCLAKLVALGATTDAAAAAAGPLAGPVLCKGTGSTPGASGRGCGTGLAAFRNPGSGSAADAAGGAGRGAPYLEEPSQSARLCHTLNPHTARCYWLHYEDS